MYAYFLSYKMKYNNNNNIYLLKSHIYIEYNTNNGYI